MEYRWINYYYYYMPISLAGTGPYVDFKTDIYVTNMFDKSKYPVGAVFEIIEKGSRVDADGYFIKEEESSSIQGVDVLGRPNNDVTHIIKVDKDKLHYVLQRQSYGELTVRVYLKDLNIPFVNLTSPTFEGASYRSNSDRDYMWDYNQIARARMLKISAYLVFPRFITEKMIYSGNVCYDGFQGMWFMCHNKYHNGGNYYESPADKYIYYKKYPRISKTLVHTQQEAASLIYDVSPRQLIITDPFFRIYEKRDNAEPNKESLYLPLCENKEGSYLTVYVYDNNTQDKEFIGSFTKEWSSINGWGDAKFRVGIYSDSDNILKLDFPAELTAKIKYEHTYYYYVTFYNPLIGECGYTSQLQPFTPSRIYGLNTTTTITPHIKSEVAIYADININVSAINNVDGGSFNSNYNAWVHIKVLDPATRNMINSTVVNLPYKHLDNISTHIGWKKYLDKQIFNYNKSYIIQTMVEYEYNGFKYDNPEYYESVKRNSDGMYGFLIQPYEQLITFDTLDNGANPLTTPAYTGEVRISREDKMAYIKLPQFTSFTGDATLQLARFWLYADSRDPSTFNYSQVPILFNVIIPNDKVPLIESNSDATEEYAIPLSDTAIYDYKLGYDDSVGWDELDVVLPVNECSVRYTDTHGHDINIKLDNSGLKCIDPARRGENQN